MDGQPLPESTSPTPSMSASSAAASKQPTYTTAGTIYKPSSSQPLQPPTRRGRSIKWPIGNSSHTSDLALLPMAALSELKTSASNSYMAMQQYTPLQQNYDRAISPLDSQEHLHAKTTADIPDRQLSNTSNSPSISTSDFRVRERPMRKEREVFIGHSSDGEDGDNEAGADNDDDDDDNDDDDVNNNALKNLPVQSLKHLASYSNPTQKAAQKAFQRGARTRPFVLGSSMSSASSSSPSALASLNIPDGSSDGGQGSGTKHLLTTETYTRKRARRDDLSKLDGGFSSTRNSTPVAGPSVPPRAKSAGTETSQGSRMQFLSKNAPLPLTAGPPGQRQFRPMNVEKGLRALSLQPPTLNCDTEEEGAFSNTNLGLRNRGLEYFYEALELTTTSSTASRYHSNAVQMQGVQLPSGIIDSEEETWTISDPVPRLTDDGKAGEERSSLHASLWSPPTLVNSTSSRRGPRPMTDEEYDEHNRKLDESWYGSLNKANNTRVQLTPPAATTTTTTTKHSAYHEVHKYGAVGDGRPTASFTLPEAVDAEEAGTTIPASDSDRSLMKMIKNACNMDNDDEHFPAPFTVINQANAA
ncbi:hypothetical protein E4U42_003692 [Claviceps africana]|uniref:Uncharacterized protein n=1 Tax=Claviceps africana TaxID=83212 RepID=A0A8K0J6T6_9HYPO|nr:hypothetical protein E4U42_003692 [Claviceps africana]